MEDSCEICALPDFTKNQIEAMIHGHWTPEDLEHWIALLFRLKIPASVVKHHSESCLMHSDPFKEKWVLAIPASSLVYYCLFPRKIEKQPTTGPTSKPPGTLLVADEP